MKRSIKELKRSIKNFSELDFMQCAMYGEDLRNIVVSMLNDELERKEEKKRKNSLQFKVGDKLELVKKSDWVDVPGHQTMSNIGDTDTIKYIESKKHKQYHMLNSNNVWNECDCKLVKRNK